MDLVYRHPSGGMLWQGGMTSSGSVRKLDAADIKAVMFGAVEFQPKLPDRFDVLRARLYDNPFMNPLEARKVARCADEVSDLLASYIRSGENVLSSCWAGLNRSALMTAFTIIKLTGAAPDQVVQAIRRARGPRALSNPVFERMVLTYPSGSGYIATEHRARSRAG